MALFQTKTEIFVIGYEVLSIAYGGMRIAVELIFLLTILKFKYSFYEKAQGSFKELHFVFDNMLKKTKFRPYYQKLVQVFGFFGEIFGGSK